MSIGAKQRNVLRRKMEKTKKKAAKKALYASYSLHSDNSKRSKIKARKKQGASPLKHTHAMVNCGNVGCKNCFPTEV